MRSIKHRLAVKNLADKVVKWFNINGRDLSWRRTKDPYSIYVSEIMLQQTQVKTVIPYWERWMKLFPTIHDLAVAPEQNVLKAWEGLGYYSRARNLQKTARILCESTGGSMPNSVEALLKLPGIGRYTAGAIGSIAFGLPAPILDGNVARVLSRVFGVEGAIKQNVVREKLWVLSESLVKAAHGRKRRGPVSHTSALNQGLMELGAMICVPREPRCGECPLHKDCFAREHDRTGEFPQMAPRKEAVKRLFLAVVFVSEEGALVRRRPAGEVNGGLWEFPNVELVGKLGHKKQIKEWIGTEPSGWEPFLEVKHTITNNRITLRTFKGATGDAGELAGRVNGDWISFRELPDLPFSSAHAKIRDQLLRGADESGH